MIGWIILGVIGVFVAVLLIRAARFVPKQEPAIQKTKVHVNREKIVDDFAGMIQCRTVSYIDDSLVEWSEFERFEQLLRERFPLIYEKCSFQKIGKTGLLFKLEGESSEAPSVCMAHYDVVPVEEDGWDKPPFEGIVEDNVVWGRGTIDTKSTLCGILEAAEQLLSEGYKPKNDLYFSFSGEEEIDGPSCKDIVDYLDLQGIKPAFVLDEGGAVVENVFPGVDRQCALIGICEKGGVNLKFSMESSGGHASTPPVHTVLGQLSKAVIKIEKHPFKMQFIKPVALMFDTLGRHTPFMYRIVFANLWCFKPILGFVSKKLGGEFNAMFRTTVAVTKMEGSKAYNVLPAKASFDIDMRLLGEDTIDTATQYLTKVIKNEKITHTFIKGANASIYSDMNCEGWEILKKAIRQNWPEALVSPYLAMARSDSRYYYKITDKVYRFSPMRLSKEERALVHGNNERIPVETVVKTVEFYIRLLKML
ncbi:MAG: M20/M25/M40 family metallo-hydrolase [Lachnospiraceae bacterium]|nr:M20/M25/M40 family metallo-hydrolase [Lachnospiraceae bacterium]